MSAEGGLIHFYRKSIIHAGLVKETEIHCSVLKSINAIA